VVPVAGVATGGEGVLVVSDQGTPSRGFSVAVVVHRIATWHSINILLTYRTVSPCNIPPADTTFLFLCVLLKNVCRLWLWFYRLLRLARLSWFARFARLAWFALWFRFWFAWFARLSFPLWFSGSLSVNDQ